MSATGRGRFPHRERRVAVREGGCPHREHRVAFREGGCPHREHRVAFREGGFPNREGGFPNREGGFPNREAGFPHREAGFPHREAGFPHREHRVAVREGSHLPIACAGARQSQHGSRTSRAVNLKAAGTPRRIPEFERKGARRRKGAKKQERDSVRGPVRIPGGSQAASRTGEHTPPFLRLFAPLRLCAFALKISPLRADSTDWPQIAAFYRALARSSPSPVVELNHAVAVSMIEGPDAGLAHLDALAAHEEIRGYHLLPAARADLLRRAGRRAEAAIAYEAALALVSNEAERRYLSRRLEEVRA